MAPDTQPSNQQYRQGRTDLSGNTSRGLARDDGKRPDGVTSMPWTNGRCLTWDVTCSDTLAASYLDTAVSGPGVVATEAETRKRHEYSTGDDLMYISQPTTIETLGAFGRSAIDFFLAISAIECELLVRTLELVCFDAATERGNVVRECSLHSRNHCRR